MSGIKGKNLGTFFHLYSLYSEDKQEEEYRTPKTSVCVHTRKYLDPNYTEKKRPKPQNPPTMEGTPFHVFEEQSGWNARWMRFAKTALTLKISAEEFQEYFDTNDYDGFREILRREAKHNNLWNFRGWNQVWTRLEKQAQKLGISEEILDDYFEIDDRVGFKELLNKKIEILGLNKEEK